MVNTAMEEYLSKPLFLTTVSKHHLSTFVEILRAASNQRIRPLGRSALRSRPLLVGPLSKLIPVPEDAKE